MKRIAAAITAVGALASGMVCAQTAVNVLSAGSLRAPLTEIGRQYEATTKTKINFTFGASGLLKERIERGEAADVFTSANMEHPEALAKLGLAHPPRVFTRNQLCALLGPGLNVGPETLLDTMLRPDIKLGTSTPKAARKCFRHRPYAVGWVERSDTHPAECLKLGAMRQGRTRVDFFGRELKRVRLSTLVPSHQELRNAKRS